MEDKDINIKTDRVKKEDAYKHGLKMKALNEAANKHMVHWDPDSFVRSHPSLLRSIFEAMEIYKDQ